MFLYGNPAVRRDAAGRSGPLVGVGLEKSSDEIQDRQQKTTRWCSGCVLLDLFFQSFSHLNSIASAACSFVEPRGDV